LEYGIRDAVIFTNSSGIFGRFGTEKEENTPTG